MAEAKQDYGRFLILFGLVLGLLTVATGYTTARPLVRQEDAREVRQSPNDLPSGDDVDMEEEQKTMTITKLDKGLHMTRTLEAGIISAYWRVVVVLKDPDEFMDGLSRNELQQITRYVVLQKDRPPVIDNGTFDPLLVRLRWLSEQMSVDEGLLRTKRGLFDAGGWLLGQVFGLATGDEIEELKEMVREGHSQNQAVVHRMNEMSSTLNQLIDSEEKTREYLRAHSTVIANLQRSVAEVMEVANETREETHKLKKMAILNTYVSSVERKYELERRAKFNYREQRMALETGALTETVMPREHLNDILREARRKDLTPATPEWYYEHSLVRPLWETRQGLSYIVELPMTSSNVVGYQLSSFPFRDGDRWLKMVLHENVGYDQEDGTLTILKQCKGVKPMLCEKNLRFRQGLPCERSLIVADIQGFENCSIRTETPIHTFAYPLGINKFALVTADTYMVLRCQNRKTEKLQINPGSYLLNFYTPKCQLQGSSGWVLDSLGVHQSHQELEANVVDTSGLQLPEIPHLASLPPLVMNELHQIDGVQLHKLTPMPELSPLASLTHENVNSGLIILLFVIVFALILAIGVYYAKQTKPWRRWACVTRCKTCCAKEADKSGENEQEVATIGRGQQQHPALGHPAPAYGPQWVGQYPVAHMGDHLLLMRQQHLSPNNPVLPPHHQLKESRPLREILDSAEAPPASTTESETVPEDQRENLYGRRSRAGEHYATLQDVTHPATRV